MIPIINSECTFFFLGLNRKYIDFPGNMLYFPCLIYHVCDAFAIFSNIYTKGLNMSNIKITNPAVFALVKSSLFHI